MNAPSLLANQARPAPSALRKSAAPRRRPVAFSAACNDPVLAAVDVLDELVAAIVKMHHGKVPQGFFDWVADEMTPHLEAQVLAGHQSGERPGDLPLRSTRDWVAEICQWRLEQKIRGAAPLQACDIPLAPDQSL